MPDGRPHCFRRGGYRSDAETVYVQFSDASIYSYHGLTVDQWLAWSGDSSRGLHFNLHYRTTAIEYHPQPSWPTGLDHEFYDPDGVPA